MAGFTAVVLLLSSWGLLLSLSVAGSSDKAPARGLLLVAVPKARTLAVVDLGTMKVARTLDVPSAPQEVLVRPDNRVAYVSCDASHKIAVINLSDWKVDSLIDAGKGTDGLAWAAAK